MMIESLTEIFVTVEASYGLTAQAAERLAEEFKPMPSLETQKIVHLLFEGAKTYRPVHLPGILVHRGLNLKNDVVIERSARFCVDVRSVNGMMTIQGWRDMLLGAKVGVYKGNLLGTVSAVESS